jgi:CBS domain-containing protein
VLELMRKKGVRRMPVVNLQGGLVGMLAVDDLLQLCAEDLGAIAEIVGGQRRQETKLRA